MISAASSLLSADCLMIHMGADTIYSNTRQCEHSSLLFTLSGTDAVMSTYINEPFCLS